MWPGVIGIGLLLLMYRFTVSAARRFEARERQLGRWDQYGPLEETESPADALEPPGATYAPGYRIAARAMDERLEVDGQWHGKVLRRRAPGEKP